MRITFHYNLSNPINMMTQGLGIPILVQKKDFILISITKLFIKRLTAYIANLWLFGLLVE